MPSSGGGGVGAGADDKQQVASGIMIPSSLQRHPPAESKSGANSNTGRGDLGESLLDVSGNNGTGGSSRLINTPPTIGAPFMGSGGPGVLVSLGGGGRDRDGSQPLSGQVGNRRGDGGRGTSSSSIPVYSCPLGGGGGGGSRIPASPLVQQSSYGEPGEYGAVSSSVHGTNRKLYRGLGGGGTGGGGSNGGSGNGGPSGVSGPSGMDYAEMMARASANVAMVRVRSMHQQYVDGGGGGTRDIGDGMGGAGGSRSGDDRRVGGGRGWPTSWAGREGGVGGTGGGTAGNGERGL